jgi:hypothetical protein
VRYKRFSDFLSVLFTSFPLSLGICSEESQWESFSARVRHFHNASEASVLNASLMYVLFHFEPTISSVKHFPASNFHQCEALWNLSTN